MASCSSDEEASGELAGTVDTVVEEMPTDTVGIAAGDSTSGVEATVRLRGHSGLTAEVTVTTDEPVYLDVVARSGDHEVSVPRTATAATEHEIPIVGMRPDRDYDVKVVALDESGATVGELVAGPIHTDPLPDWMPEHEITIGEGSSPGYTLVETSPPIMDPENPPKGAPPQVVVAYDDEGEIVWWYSNTSAIAAVEQTAQGTILSHYWPFGIREINTYGEVIGNWYPGQRTVPRPKPIREKQNPVADPDPDPDPDAEPNPMSVALEGNPGDMEAIVVRADWTDLSGFHHDNWPMPNGNILGMSTTVHLLTDEQRRALCPEDDTPFNVVSDVIVEFEPDGTVRRTWDIWDAVDVVEFPGKHMCLPKGYEGENLNRDWTHSNSVVYDPRRDAVIVSVRHTDQIVAFDHGEDLGRQTDVRWILGAGSTMPFDGEPSYHQHAVEVLDETRIIVYDNGNFRPGTSPKDPDDLPYSRAVIYEVDDTSENPGDWAARQLWEHIAVEDDGTAVYAPYIGDADMLANGNVLVTHGGIGSANPDRDNPQRALIIEVVPEGESGGEIVWELRSDPRAPNTSYRSERIESFYVGDEWDLGSRS